MDWNSTAHTNRIVKFIIPINGITTEDAEKAIRSLVASYHEDIEWDPGETARQERMIQAEKRYKKLIKIIYE